MRNLYGGNFSCFLQLPREPETFVKRQTFLVGFVLLKSTFCAIDGQKIRSLRNQLTYTPTRFKIENSEYFFHENLLIDLGIQFIFNYV